MRRKQNGFTLVELLAVIIILAVIITLAIPAVMNATNRAKKQAFFMYGQSLESKATQKYTQETDNDPSFSGCAVYDINELYVEDKDAKVENTEYEGWVKVYKEYTDSDKHNAEFVYDNSSGNIDYIKYCVIDKKLEPSKNACIPDLQAAYKTEENKSTGKVNLKFEYTLRKDTIICASYGGNLGGKLVENQGLSCKDYDDITTAAKDYKYRVELTYKSRDYAVENVKFDGNLTLDKFYTYINDFNENHKDRSVDKLQISSPKCNASDPVTIKGTTTTKNKATDVTTTHHTTTQPPICDDLEDKYKRFYIRLDPNGGKVDADALIDQCVECGDSTKIPEPTRDLYIFDGWYYDKQFTEKIKGDDSKDIKIEERRDSSNCLLGYKDIILYAKWKIDPDKTTTLPSVTIHTEEEKTTQTTIIHTEEVTTTTIDTTDYTLLLDSLNIVGYPIEFSPIKFYYSVTVPYSQESITVNYAAHTPDVTTVEVLNANNLPVGDTPVIVSLTNKETNKQSNYRILVTRLSTADQKVTQPTQPNYGEWTPDSGLPDPKLDESNASLKSIMASGYTLDFDPAVYDYTLKVYNNEPLKLTIDPKVEGALINVTGNENIKDGSIIQIYVQSPNGYYHKTYTINIKYEKEISNQTKYLRNIAIVSGIILAIILLVSFSNKKRNLRVIKKSDNNVNNNNPTNN